jgi:hypothetical protein
VGKTHISQALGLEAAKQGFDVLFISAKKMLQHIHGGRADASLNAVSIRIFAPTYVNLHPHCTRDIHQRCASNIRQQCATRGGCADKVGI